MKKLLFGIAAALFIGCGAGEAGEVRELVEEHPPVGSSTSELTTGTKPPSGCLFSCSYRPEFEPLGQLCTLTSSTCVNNVRNCVYKCEVIEANPYE
ncbi:hypothetical protein [Pyxidicoccus caerfyrddinensis]|uniref:hypothetical protein n=1 Tax=Pyxidicoccus caerfyrddinensis TaxID=2709663 RepID=UPI0013DAFB10|nr:hypothetical protein [Pyxidicoccus caerfyrddinensis]